MCDRTIKMKKDFLDVNSNTNSIELNVQGFDTKSFGRHSDTYVYNNNKKLGYIAKENNNTFTAYYNFDEDSDIDCNDSMEGFSNKQEAIDWIVKNADK